MTTNQLAQLAQLVEHGTRVWEVVGSYLDRTNIQGLSLTGEMVRLSADG